MTLINEKILIIGAGRLARHLQKYYFYLLGTETFSKHILCWNRNNLNTQLPALLDKATHILVAISDSALTDFYSNELSSFHGLNPNVRIIHFSGALSIQGMASAHPLMTFSQLPLDFETYKKIHFSVSAPLIFETEKPPEKLSEYLPMFENSWSFLPNSQKPFYHAMCVLGGNFTTILIQKMIRELESMKIPRSALRLYMDQIINNVFEKPNEALSGPLARKDASTISENLKALKNDSFYEVYSGFLKGTSLQEFLDR